MDSFKSNIALNHDSKVQNSFSYILSLLYATEMFITAEDNAVV
jgi:hypothetical protein